MPTIREKYATNIVLDHNYRKGSVADQSGNGNDGAMVGTVQWVRKKKGRTVYFNQNADGYLTVPDVANLRPANTTICVFGDFITQTTNERLVYKRAATTNYDFYVDATSINLYDGAAVSTLAAGTTGCCMLGMTLTSGSTPKFYKNGVKLGNGSLTSTLSTVNTPPLYIGAENGAASVNKNHFYEVVIFNVELTQQEVAQFYEEWLQEGNFDVIDLSHLDNRYDSFDATGADSLSTYITQGRGWNTTLANVTVGNLENTRWTVLTGTWATTDSLQKINSIQKLADANMETAGVASWNASYGSPTLTKGTTTPHSGTQCLRVAYNATTNPWVGQTNSLTIGKSYRLRGWARGDGTRVPSVWLSNGGTYDWLGTSSTTWQFFDIAYKTSLAANTIYLMCHATAAGYVEFDDIELYEVLPEGHKINNVVAGIAYKPSNIAYGSWEFEMNRGGTGANKQDVILTASVPLGPTDATQNGYMLEVTNTEQILIYRIDSGVSTTKMRTAVSTVGQMGWQKYKVTRTAANVWSTYLEISGVWTLVTPDAGTNPFTDATYTTSAFTVLDLDAGDFIRNFTFKPYI